MTFRLDQLFLLGVFSAAIHWLIARSEIARPLWSRARGFVDKLLRCPACSGFWIGILLDFAGIEALYGAPTWMCIVGNGFLALVLTPVFEAVLLWGLERTAMGDDVS